MSSGATIDPRDLDLVRRIAGGEHDLRPVQGEWGDEPHRLAQVERLIRLSQHGFIRMPMPRKTFLMPGSGYRAVGPCELTADGYDVLERYPA
jgi:hypothetical protein